MKYIFGLIIFGLSLHVEALPLGNPAGASLYEEGLFCDLCIPLSVRIGFSGDYVWDRCMELDGHGTKSDAWKTRVMTNAGLIAFNVCDRFDLVFKVGASSLQAIETVDIAHPGPFLPNLALLTDKFQVNTATTASYSVGVRGTIWQCGAFTIGAESEYFFFFPEVIGSHSNITMLTYPNKRIEYKEWQVGLGLAYSVCLFECYALVPYAGVKWSGAWINAHVQGRNPIPEQTLRGNYFLPDLRNENVFGGVLGVTLLGINRAGVTAEVRFGDEQALHINGEIRF